MSSAVVLALETSQRQGGVAVRDTNGLAHVEMLAPAARHDDDLLPAIDRMMSRAGLRPKDLDAIGVSIGPGGFTGLRIAVATAKMFAETLGARLIAIPSALVAAESCDHDGPIVVALAAKRETVWATHLIRRGAWWAIEGEPGVVTAEDLGTPDDTQVVLADRHFPDSARRRCVEIGVEVIDPEFDPGACLAIAERWLEAGRTVDPLRIRPLYPRPPEAESLWEARQGKPGGP